MSKTLKSSMLIPLIMWIVFLLNFLLWGIELKMLGIHPRTSFGLIGIVAAPFLHANLQHIIANTVPLLILLPVLYYFYGNIKYQVLFFSVLIGGFAVWLIGKSGTVHIGASGLVFSLLGFFVAAALFKFTWKTFLIATAVLVLYGGALLQGVMPEEGISWEGHLFGALAGIFLAWAFRKNIRK